MKKKFIRCMDMATGHYLEVPCESLIFRPAVFGVIIKDEHILIIPARHGFQLPGGAIELGESIEEALQREIFEETGLTANILRFLFVTQDYYISAYDKKSYHSLIFVYLCGEARGEISTKQFNDYERQYYHKAEWVALNDTDKIESIYPRGLKEILRDL